MSFHHLQDLLARFKNITPSDGAVKSSCEEVILSVIGIGIPTHMMVYQNRTLYIKTHPVVKGDILVKKKELLQEFKKVLGDDAPTNIV